MIYAIILVILFGGMFIVPAIALSEIHEISYTPKQSCGPQCVIETTGFDEEQEAREFASHCDGKVYQIKNSPLWFVDYMVTERDAI